MNYVSTRGWSGTDAPGAVLLGMAPDGGLFVDAEIGRRPFDWRGCLEKDSLGMAESILSALLPGYGDMGALVQKAYAGKFETDELTPLQKVGEDYALELYRGPTSAFKDVALSMLPQLVTAAREVRGVKDEIVILTATSGDTGKAALEGFHDVPGTRIIVFYPDNGVSPVQQAQMATQSGGNVTVCAVRGNFDDCQRGVKETFAALSGRAELAERGVRLSSANSINIGRLAPQLVYYFIAYAKLVKSGRIAVGEKVDYVVPTGNFGDILAGYYARFLGLPVGRLVCASNANAVLTDFFATGTYDRRRPFLKTSSPSMDILVSSNLERLLYHVSDGDAAFVAGCMAALQKEGTYTLPAAYRERIAAVFSAYCADEEETQATIARLWREEGYLCDTHTAVAFAAAEKYKADRSGDAPVVVLSTASPYKFPAAVLQAVGGELSGDEFDEMERLHALTNVPVPANLADLRRRPVLHRDVIDAGEIEAYVLRKLEREAKA